MKLQYIDTHAHLTFPQFSEDRDEVLERAWDAGISQIVLVGAGEGLEGNRAAIELAHTDPRLFATVGIHPTAAEEFVTMREKLPEHDEDS